MPSSLSRRARISCARRPSTSASERTLRNPDRCAYLRGARRVGAHESTRAYMENALGNAEIMMVPARGVDGEGESEEDRESDAAAAEPRGELALG